MALTERNVLAVTGACFLVRRDTFDALGGFDESHAIVNNDVDFCLRCWEREKSVLYTPHATLIHHEGTSRRELEDRFDEAGFARRWGRRLRAGDPFYHPCLSRDRDDYAIDAEPLELVYSSRPLFDRTQVHDILAVKLDHIGDFITAAPALRRLQRHFPQARLYLLAAPGVAELSDLVPGLSGTIEFEFFFARSGLGQRELSEDDFRTLRQRLQPYRFDLAIDLRKAPETRPVLQYTGARWLAGFDHNGQFPWLDIVMEWETDPIAARKRSHVSEDLLRLVDAVATATEPNAGLEPRLAGSGPPPRTAVAGLPVGRKFICIHPGVGSPIRQWPPEHFATLIDLLAGTHDVEIVLIGSGDEAEIGAQVMARVERTDLVRSLIGRLSLGELPRLLASAALFVGNNSGPKHLAAGLGVPTVGIHSGTVDAREWGPIGINAVAIRRSTICSPCYFSDPGDCRRELACLTELQPIEVFEICKRLLAVEHNV
jgi:ADP-heptose:LPS heptosyltransferase